MRILAIALALSLTCCASAPAPVEAATEGDFPLLGQDRDWLVWLEARCGIRLDRPELAICITRDEGRRILIWEAKRLTQWGRTPQPTKTPQKEE